MEYQPDSAAKKRVKLTWHTLALNHIRQRYVLKMFLVLVLIYATHTIQETSTQIAHSNFALDASRRWTVSGTTV